MIKNSQFTIHNSIFLLLLMTLLALNASPALAQEPPTPTPDAEGNIFVVVQPNDSLWGIAARAGLTLEALLALNELTEDSIIVPGQRLLIGQAPPTPTPAVPTPPPPPTPTRPPPTPTVTAVPPPPTAICLKAFSDLNRNGSHDAGEPFKSAVAFTVFNAREVVGNYVTDGVSEPFCLEELEPGEYKITRSASPDETLTTEGDWTIMLGQGHVVNLAFGSYTAVTPTATQPVIEGETQTSATPSGPNDTKENGRSKSTFFGAMLVVIFLLAGWFIRLLQKRKQKVNK